MFITICHAGRHRAYLALDTVEFALQDGQEQVRF
jgi:hypothetical protein